MKVAIIVNDKDKKIERTLWETFNNFPIHVVDYSSIYFASQDYEKRWLTYSQLMTTLALAFNDKIFDAHNIIIKANIDIDDAWSIGHEYLCNINDQIYLIGFDTEETQNFFNKSKITKKILLHDGISDEELLKQLGELK